MKSSLRAIIWYIYSGETTFSRNDTPDSSGASAKSIYRFADEVRILHQHDSRSLSEFAVAHDG